VVEITRKHSLHGLGFQPGHPPLFMGGSPYKVFPQEDCNGGPPRQNGATTRDKTASNAGLSSGGLSSVANAGGGFRIIPAGPQLFLVSDVYFQGGRVHPTNSVSSFLSRSRVDQTDLQTIRELL
jgi:hypothetical protein